MILNLLHSPNSLTDEQLMQRVADKGDDRAFDVLYHRHSRSLMGMLYRQLHQDEARAADLTQDAFMRVWAGRQRYAPGSSFRTWLFSIAYNLIKNEYRHDEHVSEYELHVIQSSTDGQDDDLDVRLDNETFDRALRLELEKLSPPQRMLFSLRFEEELSVPEIARIMDIPEGTVKSRQYKLVQTLKQTLKEYE